MVKVFCTESAALAIDEMLQVHGGYGYIAEYPIEQLYRDERVQRIYEGTNEINRLLIPGLFFRRGVGGKSRHQALDDKPSGKFTAEKKLLQGMKRLYLGFADATVRKFGAGSAKEQEIQLTLADMVIHIFALESSLLRAEKASLVVKEQKQKLYQAAVTICSFRAKQQFVDAAEKYAAFLGEESLFTAINEATLYQASNLLSAKRRLADAVSQAEKYIF